MTQPSATTATPSASDTSAVPPRGNPISPLIILAIVAVVFALGARYHRRRRR